MNYVRIITPALAALVLLGAVTGCNNGSGETITETQETTVTMATTEPATTQTSTPSETDIHEPDYAADMTENMLLGLNTGDYAAFSRDFSEPMLEAMTEALFEQTRASITALWGEYQSITYVSTQLKVGGIYTVVTYRAVFAKKDDAAVQVTFLEAADGVLVYGLYFP